MATHQATLTIVIDDLDQCWDIRDEARYQMIDLLQSGCDIEITEL